jgi:glycosyltransferase involved in cell wall biosynthesis
MIYVDVTAACLLPLQSGIPRTTRGVFELLRDRLGRERITPIFWQPFRNGYTALSSRARALLENPFNQTDENRRTPRDATLPLLRASFSDLRSWPDAVRFRQKLQSEDTLFLTSLFPDNRLGYLRRLAKGPGWKVAIFHDAIPLRDPLVPAWEKTRHVEALRLLAQLNLVIAVSQAAADDLNALWKEHEIPPASVAILPWPVPFNLPRPLFSPPARDPKKVLYVSRLKQVKNHATLFTACEKLWSQGISFQLELIGCEDEAKESRAVAASIARLQSTGRPILWRGHVSEKKLHAAYERATFTVFPSLREGFGLPIVESLWHGRAVLCSGRDAVGELARAGGCLQTDVGDAEILAQTMQWLLQDESACLNLAREAYARPMRSWDEYWRELEPLLESRP